MRQCLTPEVLHSAQPVDCCKNDRLDSGAQPVDLGASVASGKHSQEAHQMKASAEVPVQVEGCRDAVACCFAAVECGFVGAGIDFAGTEELENLH